MFLIHFYKNHWCSVFFFRKFVEHVHIFLLIQVRWGIIIYSCYFLFSRRFLQYNTFLWNQRSLFLCISLFFAKVLCETIVTRSPSHYIQPLCCRLPPSSLDLSVLFQHISENCILRVFSNVWNHFKLLFNYFSIECLM